MQRIMVMGPCGAGKSTFAIQLGNRLGIETFHLDKLSFAPGWVEMPETDWLPALEKIVASERWIIDGNDTSTMDLRLDRADTIIFLDFPSWLCTWRVLKRVITLNGKVRPDMAPGCPERFDLEFLLYVFTWRQKQRHRVLARLQGHENKLAVLRAPKELAAFLENLDAKPT